MKRQVITFYSYKGGVGRSFAVANIGTILAQWGARVLIVDWDIEAPGLNHYFAAYRGVAAAGVLDFLDDCSLGTVRRWSEYAQTVSLPSALGELHLMPASADAQANGRDYMSLVQNLNWDELYLEHGLGRRLEELRAGWLDYFDYVLLDSRTGVTDFSGVTTAQLPDVLAFMFTANEQSLEGCTNIARRALEARRGMPLDRSAILALPIPARLELRDEYEQAQKWRHRFTASLSSFLSHWAPRDIDHTKLLDLLTIPYVPRWTFGEELAALTEQGGSSGIRSPSEAASYACETIAAAIAHGLGQAELLTSSRDEYVHAARSQFNKPTQRSDEPVRIFVSATSRRDAEGLVASLRDALQKSSRLAFEFTGGGLLPGESMDRTIQSDIDGADAYLVIFGSGDGHGLTKQVSEVEWMIRQNLRAAHPRPLIPIVLPGGERSFYGSRLADYQAAHLDLEDVARGIVPQIADRLRRQLESRRLHAHGEDFLANSLAYQPIVLGAWSRNGSSWSAQGPQKFLLSQQDWEAPFRIEAELELAPRTGAGNAGDLNTAFVLGWQGEQGARRYWSLTLDGTTLSFEKVGLLQSTPMPPEMVPCKLDAGRLYAFEVTVTEDVVVLAVNGVPTLQAPAPFLPRSKVGLRAWRSSTKCTRFRVSPL